MAAKKKSVAKGKSPKAARPAAASAVGSCLLQPLDDRIAVVRLEAEEKTAGGIVLPDTAKEKPQQARVVAVGPGRLLEDGTRQAPAVKPGDKVLFGKYSGNDVKLGGEDCLILHESDILARLED